MRCKSSLFKMLVIALAMLLSSSSIIASTILVRKDGTGDYLDLLPAISAAIEGDTIKVGPGQYSTCNEYVLYCGLHIISEEGPEVTSIYNYSSCCVSCGYAGSRAFRIADGSSDFTISGFTMHHHDFCQIDEGSGTYCGDWRFDVIEVNNSTGKISNNIFTQNIIGTYAIILEGASDVFVENNIFYSNIGGAIGVYQSSSATIRSNTIAECSYSSSSICMVDFGCHATIQCNIIINNDVGFGINSIETPTQQILISCNDVWNNTGGNYGGLLSDMTGYDGNISADPMFCGIGGSGNYYLQGDSPCACGNTSQVCYTCQIGCLPVNCSVAVEENSWSDIKSLYK